MIKSIIDYLKILLGVERPIVVTILLTLSTFALGFIINWGALVVIRWLKKKRYRASMAVIIQDFLISCKTQYDIYLTFPNQKGYLHGELSVLRNKSNFGLNYLSKLDVATFIENFSKIWNEERRKDICKLFELVENVKFQSERLAETQKLVQTKLWEHSDEYQGGLDGLRKLQDDLYYENIDKDIKPEIYSYVQPIFNVFNAWLKNGGITHIHNTNSQIVLPLYELAKSSKPHPYTGLVINHCLKCLLAVDNINVVEALLKDDVAVTATINKKAYDEGTLIYKKWI